MATMVLRRVSKEFTKTNSALKFTNQFTGIYQRNPFRHITFSAVCQDVTGRKFTKKHEWVSVNGNVATIGITNYAQEALGDIVYAQLPEIGSEYKTMDECGALESVKAASELYCPVSGKILETNQAVETKSSLINTSCYDEGWLFKVELHFPKEIDSLMDEEQYNNYLKTQSE